MTSSKSIGLLLKSQTTCEKQCETFGRGVPISKQSNVTWPPTATLASSKTFKNSGCVNPARINFEAGSMVELETLECFSRSIDLLSGNARRGQELIFRFVFIGSIVLSPNLDRLQLNYATSSCNLICFPFPLKFVQVNGEIMASVIAWLQNYSIYVEKLGIALLESYRFICLG
ncbi:hypothetical protein T4B_10570 [Trichinella pseudospiralis]|uniref:Uncharacterized protein n=1 Tax=Trichinella pseudospiralis TaxID=6337 RepID=A0A0V1IFV4_TRIPS|nr:hypothetical protein T4B_10570 [Trichinella pseudospiralis]